MAATKRAHEAISADPSDICKAFAAMAASLDARNERRESVYKLARDITAASKKVIFSLHRSASGPPATRAEALVGARKEMRPIHIMIGRIHAQLAQGGADEYYRFVCGP
jgi:predicted translin family RNA/ssDNA-binding protein